MSSAFLANLPMILGTVVALVFLEGLLSADNALVLAVMVRHLPKEQQKRALRYGIWGALVFRLIAVVLSTALIKFWMFKVVGGIYLIYLAVNHFFRSGHSGGDVPAARRGFWGTVVAVEVADIVFSIDSIVAAVAMVPDSVGPYTRLGVVYTGGILGIITMRYVAGYFIDLLERFQGLEAGAYCLVAWIGGKLVLGGLDTGELVAYRIEMPEWLFWSGMIVIVAVSLVVKPGKKKDGQEYESVAVEVGQSSAHKTS